MPPAYFASSLLTKNLKVLAYVSYRPLYQLLHFWYW